MHFYFAILFWYKVIVSTLFNCICRVTASIAMKRFLEVEKETPFKMKHEQQALSSIFLPLQKCFNTCIAKNLRLDIFLIILCLVGIQQTSAVHSREFSNCTSRSGEVEYASILHKGFCEGHFLCKVKSIQLLPTPLFN